MRSEDLSLSNIVSKINDIEHKIARLEGDFDELFEFCKDRTEKAHFEFSQDVANSVEKKSVPSQELLEDYTTLLQIRDSFQRTLRKIRGE